MTFSIMFWNIWLDNQINGRANGDALLREFDRLLDEYQPDYLGLNEVLQATGAKTPFVLDYLQEKHGYSYGHFAPASPLNDDWIIGVGFCSQTKPLSAENVPISKDTPAEHRGYPGHQMQAIVAKLTLDNYKKLNFIVAHPVHLRPYNIKDHYEATASLNRLVRTDELSRNTILGGDFNEPGFMPRAFRTKVADVLHFRTGTPANPTWHFNAKPSTMIRANLDQLYWSRQSEFSLTDFKLLATTVSDHQPMLATFTFK